MDGPGSIWRRLALPVLAAAITAALVAVAVVGLRASYDATTSPGVGTQGVVTAGTSFTGPVRSERGFITTNNITMSTGSLYNSSGYVTVTDGLLASALESSGTSKVGTSETVATWESVGTYLTVGTFATVGNGLGVAGNLTMSTGSLLNSRGAVTVTDDLVLGGNVTDGDSMLRLGENTVVTGTLGVSSQINAANGVAVTGNITAAGGISATGVLRGYGLALQPATTLAITTGYGITPGNYSLILLKDDGGQATGSVTLSASTSIVDGTYVGQLLLVMYIDTDGAEMVIKDNANCQLSGNTDVSLGIRDSVLLVWDGTDWIELCAMDNA